MNEDLREACLNALSAELRAALESGSVAVVGTVGMSMNPFIYSHRGDRVVLRPVNVNDLNVYYSVPLFVRQNDNRLILHRLIAKKDGIFIIQGDGETSIQYVKPEQIVAEAIGFYRKGKYVDCENRGYRRYVRIWMALRFIRPAWLFCRRQFRRVCSRVFRKQYWKHPDASSE